MSGRNVKHYDRRLPKFGRAWKWQYKSTSHPEQWMPPRARFLVWLGWIWEAHEDPPEFPQGWLVRLRPNDGSQRKKGSKTMTDKSDADEMNEVGDELIVLTEQLPDTIRIGAAAKLVADVILNCSGDGRKIFNTTLEALLRAEQAHHD